MANKVRVELTEREAEEVRMLLNVILTNGDQWEGFDLPALRRVSKKLGED